MLLAHLLIASAFAGQVELVTGVLRSYTADTLTVQTPDGKLVKVKKSKQTTQTIQAQDELLGKPVTLVR